MRKIAVLYVIFMFMFFGMYWYQQDLLILLSLPANRFEGTYISWSSIYLFVFILIIMVYKNKNK